MGISQHYQVYRKHLLSRFWAYRRSNFGGATELFDARYLDASGPCVFTSAAASRNLLTRPGSPEEVKKQIASAIPTGRRHRWFRSMSSSQALTQSVFANLRHYHKLGLLSDLVGDDGKPMFIREPMPSCELEFEVDHLGERPLGRTSIDVRLGSRYVVAVECKLAETEIGPCSRPGLHASETGYCNGRYEYQEGRATPCSLTEIGVRYWTHIPALFSWVADQDSASCPLRHTYQLVRNVLAACVRRGDPPAVDPASGHCVLLYDSNNPVFAEGGDAMDAWQSAKGWLKYPELLQKCSWQELLSCVRADRSTSWLYEAIGEKYGLVGDPPSSPPVGGSPDEEVGDKARMRYRLALRNIVVSFDPEAGHVIDFEANGVQCSLLLEAQRSHRWAAGMLPLPESVPGIPTSTIVFLSPGKPLQVSRTAQHAEIAKMMGEAMETAPARTPTVLRTSMDLELDNGVG